jgi:glycosyltransferase involved in cell wall biosynthesis
MPSDDSLHGEPSATEPRPPHRVSCVLPAHNEAESLPDTVAGWAAALTRLAAEHEIIVVDDGSTDDTPRVLDALRRRHERLRVVAHDRNQGYGAAVLHGFDVAAFPLLLFSDADGQYDPRDLGALLQHVDHADLVAGYRRRRADPALRRILSSGYNAIARRILGVELRDLNCAFKLIHRDALRRLGLRSRDFAINAELATRARRAGLRIVEVPVRHRPRRAGRSTVRAVHVVAGLYGIARLRGRSSAPAAGNHAGVAVGGVAVRLQGISDPRAR